MEAAKTATGSSSLEAWWDPASSEVVMHEHAKGAHHSSAAVVELDVQLCFLLLWIGVTHPQLASNIAGLLVRRDGARPRAFIIPPCGHLHQPNEEQDLCEAKGRHCGKAPDAIWNVGKFDTCGRREVARPTQNLLHRITQSCHHCNTSVLELDRAPAAELLWCCIFCQAKRIPVWKQWACCTELSCEIHHARHQRPCGTVALGRL
mmetsp:Transcript_145236/g.256040  ORF Transcript_145236/g.256040 Transcript_145236/m.256040 type:complete len:205 (-) Transcript_145236:271-885(-)